MIIFVLDDEPIMLQELGCCIKEAEPNADVRLFARSSQLLSAITEGNVKPDVVFTDIEMPGLSGIELAKEIKRLCPIANMVLVTGFPEYALDAVQQHVSGFIVKPVSVQKIRAEIENLRYPIAQTNKKRVFIQCFGDFEVFADGIPLTFTRSKAKELLAYLVDRRGAKCTPSQIASVIWEDGIYDRNRQKLLSIIRADLIKSLEKASVADILANDRDGIAVIVQKVDCDYYAAMEGDDIASKKFIGEYMNAYSWAEVTTALLTRKL